jgi:urease accessory protein
MTVSGLKRLAAAATLCMPAAALAHHFMGNVLPQTFAEGLLSGFGHPLIGADHAAFIIGAGLLLARMPRGLGLYALAALIAGSLAGAALHLGGWALPLAEAGIALSVIVTGVLVFRHRHTPMPALIALLSLAGLLQGHAYAETIFGAEQTPLLAYLLGFSMVQFAVAGSACLLYRAALSRRAAWLPVLTRALGLVIGAGGAVFLSLALGA